MVEPYYQDELVTLYHGDCREIMQQIEIPELILTDPPYNLMINTKGRIKAKNQDQTLMGDGEFSPQHILDTEKKIILWGANCYSDMLPMSPRWLAWDKVGRNGLNLKRSEFELAWTNCVRRPQMFRMMWMGSYRARAIDRSVYVHPTQKPIILMEWCINLVKPKSILDAYAGGGSTLIAAKRLGIPSVGIEMDPRYIDIIVNRLNGPEITAVHP